MARKESAETAANTGRLKQIALTYKMTRKVDSKVGLVVAGVGVVTFGVFLVVGFLINHPIYLGILGFILAFLAMAIIFGRRAERAAFGQMEGQPGAAAAVLENVGRGWTTTPAVAMNRSQDVVHRAVGKAGIVLVAEGNPNRLKSLLAAEKKRMARIVLDVPVHDIIVGDGEGQVPLKKVRTDPAEAAPGTDRTAGDRRQRPVARPGRPDEQYAAAEGPDAEGHADAARRKDALTAVEHEHDHHQGGPELRAALLRFPARSSGSLARQPDDLPRSIQDGGPARHRRVTLTGKPYSRAGRSP